MTKTARERAYDSSAARSIREYQDLHSDPSVRVGPSIAPQVIALLIAGLWLLAQVAHFVGKEAWFAWWASESALRTIVATAVIVGAISALYIDIRLKSTDE